ncbi:unnamed protein product [Rotaria sp. Silwood2]|nr:unnamed protein product [Rotaria sp. Silwood2]CAF4322331.1 unnamed protein product [Rotaria sp. Silwood2]CAF4394544.1 unnamed protein product [Rotaria sp. Silwood2]
MCTYFDWEDDGKEFEISLRHLSHEACVALTQPSYWEQLKKDTTISISVIGNYVPMEFEEIIEDDEPSRLELIIESKNEKDKKTLQGLLFLIFYKVNNLEQNFLLRY